jgi:multidrug resistance protein MdtO
MTARGAGPPAVIGAAISLSDTLRRELAPRPGKLADTLRLLALIMICVLISETYGIPETAFSAYIVVFITRDEAYSSISLGIAVTIVGAFAMGATIVTLTIVAGEPALRLAAMALFSFVAMWCVRTVNGPLGTMAFVLGMLPAFTLSLADDVPALSREPATLSATWFGYTPTGLMMPPEDVLVRFILWLWVVIVLAGALVVVGHLLTGRDPARPLEEGIVSRLAAAVRFCRGRTGAMSPLPGVDGLVTRLGVAARAHKWPIARVAAERALLDAVDLLLTLLRAWPTLGGQPGDPLLKPVGDACEAAAQRTGDRLLRVAQPAGGTGAVAAVTAMDQARSALLERIDDAVREVEGALIARDAARDQKEKCPPEKKTQPLLRADAFTNPDHARFAIKVTLAVMICYVALVLMDWHSIRTCIFTCFFVALASIGETGHKGTLRLGGCILGMALGLGTIVFVIAHLESIGQLLVLLAVVLGPACWLSTSSERVQYAGWQFILAYNVGVLYGFGPSIDLTIARDRTWGILLGDVVVMIIFLTLWPVSTADVVRQATGRALDGLADLLLARPGDIAACRVAIEAELSEAHRNLLNMRYEHALTSRRSVEIGLDDQALELTRQLLGPITMFRDLAANDDARLLADWLRCYAHWVRTGERTPALAPVGNLPAPREQPSDETATIWRQAILEGLERLTTRVGPHAIEQTPNTASPEGDAVASTPLR